MTTTKITMESFTKMTKGFGNTYTEVDLIAKELSITEVIEALNRQGYSPDYVLNGSVEFGNSGYNKVNFVICDDDYSAENIVELTRILNCIGYVSVPWDSGLPKICAKNGEIPVHLEDMFYTKWQDGQPCLNDDDVAYCDCFFNIIDKESGFVLPFGEGAVDEKTKAMYVNYVEAHK